MPWSYAEDRRFIEISESSKSFDEVVKRTRRSPTAVRNAALRLGVKLAKQTASDNRLAIELGLRGKRMKRVYLWTKDEEERLKQLFLQNALPAEIAKELGRTVSAVKSKAHALGITIARFGSRRSGMPRWG
jgi:hypothetical protein